MHLNRIVTAIKPYIQIARPDHWFKNIFMLSGTVFALFDAPSMLSWRVFPPILLGLFSTCLITSSNYTINEILDAPHDRVHPVKKDRPIPSGRVKVGVAYGLWIFLGLGGLAIGWYVNQFFFKSLLVLFIMGFIYNVPPIRLKEFPYVDVLSESLNNPLRLLLGWFAINGDYLPTLSLILAYWMIGAFFMAVKRYGEYRKINDPIVAAQYRKSFRYYNEYRLILSMVYYACAFSLFFGIFMIRYRIELILSVPFMAGFIPMYMRMGFWKDSPAQYPELLYKQKGLVIYTAFCVILFLILLFVDIPFIGSFFKPLHTLGA